MDQSTIATTMPHNKPPHDSRSPNNEHLFSCSQVCREGGAVPCESSFWGQRLIQAVLQIEAKQKCTLLLRPSTDADTDPCPCSVGQIKSPGRQQGAGKDTQSLVGRTVIPSIVLEKARIHGRFKNWEQKRNLPHSELTLWWGPGTWSPADWVHV